LILGPLRSGVACRNPQFKEAARMINQFFESYELGLNSKSFGTIGRLGPTVRKPISISSLFTCATGRGSFDHT
jgi:hypothetical protein